jgi:putative thioredoxin
VLAKVDVDSNPSLAAAAQVQGIPAVRAFRDGRQVAEFTGALPEPQVREWLAGLGPQPADLAILAAEEAAEAGHLEAARDRFRSALDLHPGHQAARKGLAGVELRLRTAGQDRDALARRAAADPGDVDAVLGLADLDASSGDLEAAFRRLVESVGRTSGPARERVRVHLLALLDTLPADDPRAMTARRNLALALF